MLGVLAVVLCRLLVTCAGVAVGVLDSSACATVLAVASFVSLITSQYRPKRRVAWSTYEHSYSKREECVYPGTRVSCTRVPSLSV